MKRFITYIIIAVSWVSISCEDDPLMVTEKQHFDVILESITLNKYNTKYEESDFSYSINVHNLRGRYLRGRGKNTIRTGFAAKEVIKLKTGQSYAINDTIYDMSIYKDEIELIDLRFSIRDYGNYIHGNPNIIMSAKHKFPWANLSGESQVFNQVTQDNSIDVNVRYKLIMK